MKHQRGLSFWGFLFVAILVAVTFLLGAKVTPAVVEYFSIKKAITSIAADSQGKTVSEIRKAFDTRLVTEYISSVSSADLDVTKEAGEVIISVAYSKKIPLFMNVSLLIEFDASSSKTKRAPEAP